MKRILLLCLILASCTPPAPTPVTFTNFEQGFQSSISEEYAIAINSQSDWENFWIDLNKASRVEVLIPDEVFANQTVIAVFMGQQRSGGYSIAVDRIEEEGDKLRVYVNRSSPPPGGMVSLGFTQPYVIVTVPKTRKPVVFSG